MIKDITYCFALSLVTMSLAVANVADQELIEYSLAKQQQSFANLEHKALGDQIQLQWSGLPHAHHNNVLEMDNGIRLSYGEMVYMAGDLFGDENCSISLAKSSKASQCFQRQFNAIYGNNDPFSCHSPIRTIPAYKVYFDKLQSQILLAHQDGQSTAEFYNVHGAKILSDLNRISCGGSIISPLFPFGDYINLAKNNYDHFVPNAVTAYTVGHKNAIKTAIEAHNAYAKGYLNDSEMLLSKAYAQNAYANHYLSDALSSGHMRTPRVEISQQVHLPLVLKLLISNLMHDEDNRLGLYVHNKEGQYWKAYGDGMLNEPEAQIHKAQILKIMQESADSIYSSFISGQAPVEFTELDWLPVYTDIIDTRNHSPLFKMVNGKLLKRKDNFDPSDTRYTQWWSGILTLTSFMLGQ